MGSHSSCINPVDTNVELLSVGIRAYVTNSEVCVLWAKCGYSIVQPSTDLRNQLTVQNPQRQQLLADIFKHCSQKIQMKLDQKDIRRGGENIASRDMQILSDGKS